MSIEWKSVLRSGLALGAVIFLTGCEQAKKWLPSQAPEVISLHSAPVTRQEASASLFASACRGTHPRGGLQASGPTRHVVTVDISELVEGVPRPVHRVSGPANFTRSSVVSAQYYPTANANCYGAALETIVFGNANIENAPVSYDQIEWRLEFSPKANAAYNMEVFQLAGKITTEMGDGSGSDEVPFYADGRQFIANIKVTPGPGYYAEMMQRSGNHDREKNPSLFMRPMPDEQPYRTLRMDGARR